MDEKTVAVGGHTIRVVKPTDGQLQALVRISKALVRGSDSETMEFYSKQLDRLGTLIESLIVEEDRDTVDNLFLTGKIDYRELVAAVLGGDVTTENAEPIEAVKKASPNRVKRA